MRRRSRRDRWRRRREEKCPTGSRGLSFLYGARSRSFFTAWGPTPPVDAPAAFLNTRGAPPPLCSLALLRSLGPRALRSGVSAHKASPDESLVETAAATKAVFDAAHAAVVAP